MRVDNESELLKGNTPTLILAVLREAPRHGYAIAREIERRCDNALQFKEGTLYPALRALERDQFIVGAWQEPSAGPARKVYTLTDAGHKELARRTHTWANFVQSINSVIGGDPDVQPI